MAKDANGTSLLPSRDEPLLPVTNRNAPLLQRIRDGRNSNTAEQLASEVAQSILADEEESEEVATERMDEFITALSDELGVPETGIDEDVGRSFAAMFMLDEEDVVAIQEDGTDEEDGEDEEDSASFGSE